jgi:RNA polymerase sigma-70 factor, ECF subfamily
MDTALEAQLVARCKRGEADAWDALFDGHYAPTARFIFQLSSGFSREDAEEICQETFLSVIKGIASFHGGSRLQTWIFRIAANKARDFREKQSAAKRGGGHANVSLTPTDDGPALDPASPSPRPDEALVHGETVALVHLALDQLGEPCREIIDLRYFGDLSYDEIAGALDLNPKTVSSRLSKCLDRFEKIAASIFSRKDSTAHPV